MNGLMESIILGVLRSIATAGGAYLVSHGVMTSDQTSGFVGSVLFLGGVGFSVFDKLVVKRKLVVTAATGAIPQSVNMLKPAPQATMQPIPDPKQ
jgi:hypothetical protein